jgi:hypothetical protein
MMLKWHGTNLITYFIDSIPVTGIKLMEVDQMIMSESHSCYSWTVPPNSAPAPNR